MNRIIIFIFTFFLFSIIYGQNSINLLITDFTLNDKDFIHKEQLRNTFENTSHNPKYPFRIVDRENLNLIATTIQEERNLMIDFNQKEMDSLVIANVHYVVKGNLTNSYGDKNYYLNLLFIKVSKEETTARLRMSIKIPHSRLLDYEHLAILMEMELDSFVKSFFPMFSSSLDISRAKTITEKLIYQDSMLEEYGKSLIEKEKKIQNIETRAIYEPISKLNIFGSERPITTGVPGSEIELYWRMMEILDRQNMPYPKMDKETEMLVDDVIELFPKYPFSYFFKAYYEKQRNEDWQENAGKAIYILELTTSYDNHKSEHDEVLTIIKNWMN